MQSNFEYLSSARVAGRQVYAILNIICDNSNSRNTRHPHRRMPTARCGHCEHGPRCRLTVRSFETQFFFLYVIACETAPASMYGHFAFAYIVYSSACMWLSRSRAHTQPFDHSVPNLTFHQYLWSAATRDSTLFFLFYLHSKRKSISIKMFGGQQILVLSKSIALSIIGHFRLICANIFHRQ